MDKISFFDIDKQIVDLSKLAESESAEVYSRIDEISEYNTQKVLAAFQKHRVSEACFAGTTGYGYDDMGRDALDKIYASVFGTEDALVRIGFVNGTHAISTALFCALRPGDTLLSATGEPYDTIQSAIGIKGDYPGSLADYGVAYQQAELIEGRPDLVSIRKKAAEKSVKAVLIQRSGGYSNRDALSVQTIAEIIAAVKEVKPEAVVVVDNCYGEFTEREEPWQADLIAGSLIKNPGGGLAPTGAYIAGKAKYVDIAAMRQTSPGVGRECGSTLGNNRLLYQGLFMAPHTVAQSLKTAVFCANIMGKLGYKARPLYFEPRYDIIQSIELGSPEKLKAFCRGIQLGAPVDSYVTPEPWEMPGYDCEVIMAAGAFIQGASIELSADGPMLEPYTAFMQGGLTYESGKLGVMLALSQLLREGKNRA